MVFGCTGFIKTEEDLKKRHRRILEQQRKTFNKMPFTKHDFICLMSLLQDKYIVISNST